MLEWRLWSRFVDLFHAMRYKAWLMLTARFQAAVLNSSADCGSGLLKKITNLLATEVFQNLPNGKKITQGF